MKALLNSIVFALLSTVSTGAAAGSGDVNTIYTEQSKPGESMDSFVRRIAPRAVLYTNKYEAEVCGAIDKSGDGYSIRLTTDRKYMSCTVHTTENTVSTFHTHPRLAAPRFSQADYAESGYMARSRPTARAMAAAVGVEVYHHAGRGTDRLVR